MVSIWQELTEGFMLYLGSLEKGEDGGLWQT